ncbi:hypothetical protein IEQ34_001245 [Dendrobium chrysotoxum]|uniref:Uncharacterized protein n=1 Tax=Dendrobium chrysotoxum TaxID=161865 RepID=A0AAV7HMS4_DENCH|nr:hypothetical protein IEQ34_001245 [Dendrobium chrysotoxum]
MVAGIIIEVVVVVVEEEAGIIMVLDMNEAGELVREAMSMEEVGRAIVEGEIMPSNGVVMVLSPSISGKCSCSGNISKAEKVGIIKVIAFQSADMKKRYESTATVIDAPAAFRRHRKPDRSSACISFCIFLISSISPVKNMGNNRGGGKEGKGWWMDQFVMLVGGNMDRMELYVSDLEREIDNSSTYEGSTQERVAVLQLQFGALPECSTGFNSRVRAEECGRSVSEIVGQS